MQVSTEFAQTLFDAIYTDPNTEIKVDLPNQTVTLLSTGASETFEINGYKKGNMLNGFDDIDYLQNIKEEIKMFESTQEIY